MYLQTLYTKKDGCHEALKKYGFYILKHFVMNKWKEPFPEH